jgi:hypothetical protein
VEPGAGGPIGDLSLEEQAALPPDTPVRRLLDDRRVRIAAITGIPLVVALLAAAAIFAHSFGVARSIRIDGPSVLAPGWPTSLRIGYAELDDYGLPHSARVDHVRLEVCLGPDASRPTPAAGCLLLGEGGKAAQPGDIAMHLEVPDVPEGTHTVHLDIRAAGKSASFSFPVRFARGEGMPARPRENGRSPARSLGRSGVVVDLVPFDGGIARGWTSALIARARGADGRPWRGTLYPLWLGDEPPVPLPPTLQTDAAGLAGFALRSESFEYRLALSTAPYPAMDPLEVSVGLLPEEVLLTSALFEIPFRPMAGPLRVASSPLENKDRPLLRAGDPLVLALDRPCAPPTPLLAEVYRDGHLLRLAIGESPGPPIDFGDFVLPQGMIFAQLHRPGDVGDSVVGRHIWVGREPGPGKAEAAELLRTVGWADDEGRWTDAVVDRLATLSPTELERLQRYALSRMDSVWYDQGTLFDSHPGDAARVTELRERIKTGMGWGIGALAAALVGLAAFVVVVSLRDGRKRRAIEAAQVAAAPAGAPRERRSIYERSTPRDGSGLWRIAAMCLILAAALAGIALLVWGMRQTYLAP